MTEDRDRERLNSSNVEGDEAWQGSAGTVGRYHAMECKFHLYADA